MFRRLIFVLFLILKFQVNAEEACKLDLEDRFGLPEEIPHILTLDGKFYQSDKNSVKIQHGNKAVISCRSYFVAKFQQHHDVIVTCKNGFMVLDMDNSTKSFSDLGCTDSIIQEVKMDVHKCKNMEGSHYVYRDLNRKSLVNLAEHCYDSDLNREVFTRIYLSKKYPANELEDRRVSININLIARLFSTFRSFIYIKIDNANKPLENFINIDKNIYFITKKLSPMQILFDNAQLDFGTDYVAMWKTIAEGNWNRLMNDIKTLSKNMNNTLEVIIGTHETLVLGGKMQFMKDQKFPIPKYTWAVINDNTTKSAVAIITMNNPLLTSEQVKEQIFCNNICDEINWASELLKDKNNEKVLDGYTFCCSMNKFNVFSLDYKPINLLV